MQIQTKNSIILIQIQSKDNIKDVADRSGTKSASMLHQWCSIEIPQPNDSFALF